MPSAREILGNFTARDNAFQSLGVRQRLEGCRECKEGLLEIPVERIYGDPDQPRKRGGFDEESLRRTGELIRSEGQLQPIRVRWDQERAAYRIVVGERRWRSAKLVGLTHVKAIVEPDDGESPLIRQIVENLCREDLCPLDRAESYRRLMEQKGWTAASVPSTCTSRRPRSVPCCGCWRRRRKYKRGCGPVRSIRARQSPPRAACAKVAHRGPIVRRGAGQNPQPWHLPRLHGGERVPYYG